MATTYKVQVGDEVRTATANEAAELDALNEVLNEQAKTKAESKSDKATARQAVLDRLGITADEATLLLG